MARRKPLSKWPQSDWPSAPAQAAPTCELCGREVPGLTVHHLVPVLAGRRQGIKAQELPTARLCPACHKYLHSAFSIAELADQYNTLEALRQQEDVARFLKWLRKQPGSKGVKIRRRN